MTLYLLVLAGLIAIPITVPAGAPGDSARSAPVAVGERAPEFTLPDHTGATVSLTKTLERGPAVVVFFRGSWCPFCVRQLGELRSLIATGERASLLAVSVENPESSKRLAEKIAADGRGAVSFPLLSDGARRTVDAYGLRDPAFAGEELDGTPRTAVYVVASDGTVAWARVSEDYRKRPSNAEIRAALDALGETSR